MLVFDNNQMLKEIKKVQRRVDFYKLSLSSSPCFALKLYYYNKIANDIDYMSSLLARLSAGLDNSSSSGKLRQQKAFTLQELSTFDGSGGKPAYVAVSGTVYDVSMEGTWGGASHFGLLAGKDLTSQFNGCHGNISILSNLPKVGILK